LLRRQPPSWFPRSWPEEIGDALIVAGRQMKQAVGDGPRGWGQVRTLTLKHPLGQLRVLGWLFNRGPVPWGGDHTTPSQAAVMPLDPLGNPSFIASLRMVVDVGAWSNSRFALPGGQSGNPMSPHYADQFDLWQRGDGIAIAWTEEEIAAVVKDTLRLAPVSGSLG
jgi:penicillin amidase